MYNKIKLKYDTQNVNKYLIHVYKGFSINSIDAANSQS